MRHGSIIRNAKGDFTFHGKYKSKILAARKEREIPGSFVKATTDGYFVVLKPVRRNGKKKPNPGGLTLIYEKITRVEGTKGRDSAFPGQRFYHNFKRPYPSMWGTPDGKKLIICEGKPK